jgi:tetrapyrrole methylase family protein/MazG family protein
VLDALVAEARLRWGLDPSGGVQVVAWEALPGFPLEPTRPAIVVPEAMLRTAGLLAAAAPPPTPSPVPGRHAHSTADPLSVLRRLYPADHLVGRLGRPEPTTVGGLVEADVLGPCYLPAAAPEAAPASFWAMPAIAARLRGPDGCPWDREQSHASLRKHLLEEAYEVYDALAGGASPALAEELGDLLLQVVLHAQLAAEAGVFDLADVAASIGTKIVRRHPHVFGDAVVRTAADVNRQWERIKAAERAGSPEPGAAEGGHGTLAAEAVVAQPAEAESGRDAAGRRARSALDGISPTMPALAASQEMQERAASLGYDWPSVEGILDKVAEELAELAAAASSAEREEEIGDLLMVVVNLARHHGVEAEAALRAANDKFRRRFAVVERLAAERGVALRDLSFAELDALWDAAKALVEEHR